MQGQRNVEATASEGTADGVTGYASARDREGNQSRRTHAVRYARCGGDGHTHGDANGKVIHSAGCKKFTVTPPSRGAAQGTPASGIRPSFRAPGHGTSKRRAAARR